MSLSFLIPSEWKIPSYISGEENWLNVFKEHGQKSVKLKSSKISFFIKRGLNFFMWLSHCFPFLRFCYYLCVFVLDGGSASVVIADADKRYYDHLISSVPPESHSVPLILHCLLEQVRVRFTVAITLAENYMKSCRAKLHAGAQYNWYWVFIHTNA